jgi:hypothetical protein
MGTIGVSKGAYRALGGDQSLINLIVSGYLGYGMEEVIGSIPIRSTNPFNNLGGPAVLSSTPPAAKPVSLRAKLAF